MADSQQAIAAPDSGTQSNPGETAMGHSEWAGSGRPGLFQPRPVIIRTFWPEARVLGSGTLVGHDGENRWILLTDFPLDPGLGLTVGQVVEELGTIIHFMGDVQTCRAGLRPGDAGKDVFISCLECRRAEQRD